MSLTQEVFLGASITNFNGVIGWGSEPTTLSVGLVVDDKNLDFFNPPDVGHPINFNYQSWNFRGILQSWKYKKGESGFLYDVVCLDPREILDGYQIILDGYTQTITAPNIANVYGYWENIGFGESKKNESGMPWEKIKTGVQTIINSPNAYGTAISLRGFTYGIDLSELPNLGTSYRVGAGEISLMSFISEICDAGSQDFFIELLPSMTIKVRTIDRSRAVSIGALTSFINSITGIVSSESGVEFKNETNGKLLFGAQRIDMYGQTPVGQNIWPFWGFEPNFDLKMGTGLNNAHQVDLDTTSVQVPGIGDTYTTDVLEMRMLLESQYAWETFLEFKDTSTGIHAGKYTALKLIGSVNFNFDVQKTVQSNMPTHKDSVERSSGAIEDDHEEAMHRLYSFLRGYAIDFYGKRFIVSIPDVEAAREPDTDKIRVSLEPVNEGFIDPSAWDTAIANNLIPQDFNRLTNEDGRFPPYARFDNIVDLDFSEISSDKIVYNNNKTSAFIRCSVHEGVAYEDVANLTGARAEIILPGAVRQRITEKTDFGGLLRRVMDENISSGPGTTTDKENQLNQFGVDNIFEGEAGIAVVPDFVAIPLQNNKEVYGPWQIVGANGKMEIESDPSLAPWFYGGFAEMDLVGNAKVQDNVSFMQELETGSVEIPGIPAYNMGQQIVTGGPYVTDIDVSVGEQGVTSVYKFSTWTPRFGRLNKSNIQKFSTLSKKNSQAERKARDKKRGVNGLTAVEIEQRTIKKSKRKGGTSSHGIVSGEGVVQGDEVYPNVFVQPHYNFTSQLGRNYEKKAAVSMDGIFRPFTTNVEASSIGMPYFRTPASGADFPTSSDLNPYRSGTDIVMALRGSSLPDDLTLHRDPYFESDWRGMALRGPLVLAGWGYDSDGKPVPNESGGVGETRTDNFASGYLQNQGLWPVGPVDLPWDADRGVWVGGGASSKLVRIVRESGGADFPSAFNKVYYAKQLIPTFSDFNTDVTLAEDGDPFLVGNYRQNIVLESAIYVANKFNGKYYLDNQTTFAWGNL